MADKDVFTARYFIADYVSFIIHQGYQSRFDSSSGMNYVMSGDADDNVTMGRCPCFFRFFRHWYNHGK